MVSTSASDAGRSRGRPWESGKTSHWKQLLLELVLGLGPAPSRGHPWIEHPVLLILNPYTSERGGKVRGILDAGILGKCISNACFGPKISFQRAIQDSLHFSYDTLN